MITPEIGKIYIIKHYSGMIKAKYTHSHSSVFAGNRVYYYFQNMVTGREIVLKSRVKIKRVYEPVTAEVANEVGDQDQTR